MKSPKPRRILIIDEDSIEMEPFQIEFTLRGFEVIMCKTADDCVDFLSTRRKVDLFIVDIMLPVREKSKLYTKEQTSNWLLTGLLLAKDIRRRRSKSPILLFSNTSRTRMLEIIGKTTQEISNCMFIPKSSICDMLSFGDTVEAIITTGSKPEKKPETTKRNRRALKAARQLIDEIPIVGKAINTMTTPLDKNLTQQGS